MADGWDRPIFEATFVHEDVLIRADLLLPAPGGWHVAEVKATTGLKAYHLADIATQLWVMRQNALPVVSASIRHIDRGFVLARADDYAGPFTDTFVDDAVAELIAERPQIAAAVRAVLAGDEPEREMGAHCDTPFACSFKSWCGRVRPAELEWSVTLLSDAAGEARTVECHTDHLRVKLRVRSKAQMAAIAVRSGYDRVAVEASLKTCVGAFRDLLTILLPNRQISGQDPVRCSRSVFASTAQ